MLEVQNETIRDASKQKEEELDLLQAEHNSTKEGIEGKQQDIREEIGYYDRTIRDANKKLKEYQKQNIEEAVEKHKQREQLQVELNMARKEYETLTSNVSSIELKYSTLLEQLKNERASYINKINSKTSTIFNHYNECQLLAEKRIQ